jgi:hypothetical protein
MYSVCWLSIKTPLSNTNPRLHLEAGWGVKSSSQTGPPSSARVNRSKCACARETRPGSPRGRVGQKSGFRSVLRCVLLYAHAAKWPGFATPRWPTFTPPLTLRTIFRPGAKLRNGEAPKSARSGTGMANLLVRQDTGIEVKTQDTGIKTLYTDPARIWRKLPCEPQRTPSRALRSQCKALG